MILLCMGSGENQLLSLMLIKLNEVKEFNVFFITLFSSVTLKYFIKKIRQSYGGLEVNVTYHLFMISIYWTKT
jgi:hypothetical protein